METETDYSEKHKAFQKLLSDRNLSAWLQPVTDEFQGEYLPAYAERLGWLSGFYASAGLAIIVPSGQSAMLVDGRYIVQARRDCDAAYWQVHNIAHMSAEHWISQNISAGAQIACDSSLHSHRSTQQLSAKLAEQGNTLIARDDNLIDELWCDKPHPPAAPVRIYPAEYAGLSADHKRQWLAAWCREHALDGYAITQPDAIMWLLNVRGADVECNPLLLCYAVVWADASVSLITHPRSFDAEVMLYLTEQQVRLHTFDALWGHLIGEWGSKTLGADEALVPHRWWIVAAAYGHTLMHVADPVQLQKAIKTSSEQQAIRRAHYIDGLAMVRFMSACVPTLASKPWDELSITEALAASRQRYEGYLGPSFSTISGAGEHGAIVHYRATAASNRKVKPGDFLLLDSGGQYLEGTTDITRVFPVGKVSEQMRWHYTLVLKGHIALARAVFPRGTSGKQLDVLARQYLWQHGLDYDHGTGHGVGCYLCVHEGPQRISKKGVDIALEPGMVLSNEPGYYAESAYGIRIENLVMVQPAATDGYLCFETLTVAPIALDCALIEMLSIEEKTWLNDYHAKVYARLASGLDAPDERWLAEACRPLSIT